jgi:TPR repeat protein
MADRRRLIIPVAHTLVLLAFILAMAAPVGAAEPPVHECDRLAAHKHDRQRVADGVLLEDIDATSAIEACSSALEEFPGTLRFEFQLGRALQAGRHDEDAVEYYRSAAEQGFAPAQAALGQAYLNGAGVVRNQQKAFNWYWKSAVQDNGTGQAGLGYIYSIRSKRVHAKPWLMAAAKQGVARAQAHLALTFEWTLGVPPNYPKAVMWAMRSAQQGNVLGLRVLARFYAKGIGVPKDMATARHYFELALAKLKPSATGGDPKAQVALGGIYANGAEGLGDYSEALKWYRKAADTDNAEARYRIAEMYLYGHGVTEDLDEAISWFRQAAQLGYLEAAEKLGRLYEYESPAVLNQDEAMKWYRFAATRGHSSSQVQLGFIYRFKYLENQPQHSNRMFLESASYWWRKAAEQGEYYLVHHLIESLISFSFVSNDDEMSDSVKQHFVTDVISIMKIIAEMGNEDAQMLLGYYYHGEIEGIVSKDSREATLWFGKAAERGNLKATQLLEEINAE